MFKFVCIQQLRDDLMTMLIAGHETTAAVLTWAIFLLSQVCICIFSFLSISTYVNVWPIYTITQNPSKLKKAQEEVDSVLGRRGKITVDSLKKLEYVLLIIVHLVFFLMWFWVWWIFWSRFIKLIIIESLRLYPQPPLLIRRSLKPDKLPGTKICRYNKLIVRVVSFLDNNI